MARKNGIDVSVYQGNIDFDRVRDDGVDFVIIRAGFGRYARQRDAKFETNYKHARECGLNIGAYWYSYADSVETAKEEARAFMRVVRDKKFEYPLCYDIEDSIQERLSRRTVSKMIKGFCEELENNGYYAMIYSDASFLQNKVSDSVLDKYDVWVADYGVTRPMFPEHYGIWQHTSDGRAEGISGHADLDYSYKDYPKIMVDNGLNGY